MLIRALCDYADTTERKGEDVVLDSMSRQDVSFRIMLTPEGDISSIDDIRVPKQNPMKNSKEILCPDNILLPRRNGKTAICANIIEHRPLYIFGLGITQKSDNNNVNDKKSKCFNADDKKAQKSHESFVKNNLEFCGDIDSVIVIAYRKFIEKWKPEEQTENCELMKYINEYSNSYFCFGLAGSINCKLENDKKLLEKFEFISINKKAEEIDCQEKFFCPIEGDYLVSAQTHDKIKGIKGANSSGAVLVCMKESAFESYGKKQSFNSGISVQAMMKYSSTLNILLKDEKHKVFIDDMTMLFFAVDKNDDKECELFYRFVNGNDDEKLNDILKVITDEVKEGKTGDLSALEINRSAIFYVVGLVPNSSRISQKFFYKNKFGNILQNILTHQKDMMMKENAKPISFWQIKSELVSPKSSKEVIPSPMISEILLSILNGTQYPYSLLSTIIRRIKTDRDDEKRHDIKMNDVRIGIIKAYLNCKARQKKQEEIKMSLDTTNTNQAYLCGRLFAILEKIQKDAIGSANRTINDAYFSAACTKPSIVFPKLIKLSQNHVRKLNIGSAINYKEKIQTIIDAMNGEFPSFLPLEDQGIFIIGYYQQTSDLYTANSKKEDKIKED